MRCHGERAEDEHLDQAFGSVHPPAREQHLTDHLLVPYRDRRRARRAGTQRVGEVGNATVTECGREHRPNGALVGVLFRTDDGQDTWARRNSRVRSQASFALSAS